MSRRTWLVAVLLFGSGFCALVYQTTWLREFRLIFGASTAASAAVLGVFMGGLGFGGIVLGKRVERSDRPVVFYATLELLIAVGAALSPALIIMARSAYVALGGTQTMGLVGGTIARLVLAGLILGGPTFLMGGTLPAAVRAVVSSEDVSRRSVGILYGINTLGAVSGALTGTFYLFEAFGNRLTLWWAAILNIVVALTAFHLSKRLSTEPESVKTSDREQGSGASPWFVFVAAAIVGFAFFLLEIVWYRMLAPLLGGSTFCFGLILATALLGIGMGGVAYAVFGLKRSATLLFFGLTCAMEAFFIALPYALGDRIAISAMLLRPLGTLGFSGHVAAWSMVCALVIFPAAFVAGLQFPVLIALLGEGRNSVGSQTGSAYAWNTVGALAGSLAGGFGFIPMFSAPGVWKIVIYMLGTLAVLTTALAGRRGQLRVSALFAFGIVVAAVMMTTTQGPTAFWRHSQIGVGRLKKYQESPNELRDLASSIRRYVPREMDGLESSVALMNADSVSFIVNGKSDGNAKIDAGTQVMIGLIGAALHPDSKSALVIGLGTGSSAGWLAAVPGIQKVQVAELEPAILDVARLCAPVNHDALSNPKLTVSIGDGRELLLTVRQNFDLVVSEPSNPYRAGVAGLFTREFYQSVDRRLNPGGLFLQWVQTYDIDDRTIEIFYRTLGSVFENIETWQTQAGDLLLVASHQPVRWNADQLRSRLAEEPFKSALSGAWQTSGLEGFLAHYLGNEAVTRTLQNLESWPLNTDDHTMIEFAFARNVGLTNGFQIENLRAAARAAHSDRANIGEGEVDWAQVEEARLAAYPIADTTFQVSTEEQRIRNAAMNNYLRGNFSTALQFWRTQKQQPGTIPHLLLVAECLANEGNPAARSYIDQLAASRPADADAIRAELYWSERKPKEAAAYLEKFLRALHDDPWPAQELIRRSLARATTMANADPSPETARRFYDVLKTPLCVWNCEADRMVRLLELGRKADGNTSGEYTARAIEAFEPHVIWQGEFLKIRAVAYRNVRSQMADQAMEDLVEFTSRESAIANVSAMARAIRSAEGSAKIEPNPAAAFAARR
jgi:spermidine synthase